MLENLITVKQLAEKLQITENYIYQLVRQKEKENPIPHIRIGRRVRFDPAEIEKWLEERTIQKREDLAPLSRLLIR